MGSLGNSSPKRPVAFNQGCKARNSKGFRALEPKVLKTPRLQIRKELVMQTEAEDMTKGMGLKPHSKKGT